MDGRRDSFGAWGWFLNFDKFHFEDKSGVRAELFASAVLTVAEFRLNEDLPLGADSHGSESFAESGDHVQGHGDGRAFGRSIEFSAIDESSFVVDEEFGSFGAIVFCSIAWFEDLVL